MSFDINSQCCTFTMESNNLANDGNSQCYNKVSTLVTISNTGSESNLGECQGECDNDSHCASGLACFQRTGLTPVPGCAGVGETDFDYCYNPAGSITLSGGNDNSATNLQACTGECDNDEQCAAGLLCFQRDNGETIPGCTGTAVPQ